MKKFSKLIYFIIAFALITCMAILNPAITFADAEYHPTNDAISIASEKIASVLENGKQLNIPMPKVVNADGADTYVEVRDRSGYTYTYNTKTGATTDKDGNTSDYFNLLTSEMVETDQATKVAYIQPKIVGKGVYNIRYKVVKGGKTYYSSTQSVQVKSLAYNWVFEKTGESKNIIPANSNDTKSYTLPLPTIVASDDTDTVVATYTKDDITNTAGEGEQSNAHIIVLRDGVDVTSSVVTTSGDNLGLTPALEDGRDSATYRIRYVSKVAGFSNKEYEILVSKDYKTEAELEVTHNSITNAQAGTKTVFPTANVTDKTHSKSKIEVNTVITIKKGSTVVKVLEPNQYEYKFEETGTYTVQYEVTDAYDNTAKSNTYSFDVKDTKPYIVDYAEKYDVTEDEGVKTVNGDVKTGAEYLIPSEIGYGGAWFPAIYAMDYVDGYNLTFTRRIELSTDSSVYYDLDKAGMNGVNAHGNGALDTDNTKYNEKVEFKFPEDDASIHAGQTFKVKYYAKDSYGREAVATVYTFTVADVAELSFTVDKGLSIKFPTITEHLDVESELKFTSATASETPSDSSIIADERLDVRTYYYYGSKNLIEDALNEYKGSISNQEAYEYFDFNAQKYAYNFSGFYNENTGKINDIDVTRLTSADGYTTIKLNAEDAREQNVVTIFAVAINDQGQFVIKAQEVKIDDVTDTECPYITSVQNHDGEEWGDIKQQFNIMTSNNEFNQNCDIYLPEITFGDNTDTSLEVTIQCYVDTPENSVGVVIERFAQNGISLARVHAGSYGTYYVVYTARDDAGNTMTYINTFYVQEVKKASVVVTNGSQFSNKVGETLSLALELQGDGQYEEIEYTIDWDTTPGGLGSNDYSFLLEKEGTFNATITAKYKIRGQDREYYTSTTITVTVSAVSIDWSNVESELVDRKDATGRIYLPYVTVDENGRDLNAYPTVKLVKDDKETDVEIKLDSNMSSYYFEAEDGVYKVTYNVEDAQYSTNKSKSFTITCGDIYEPTINIQNDKLSGSTVAYNGEMNVSVTMTKEDETGKYTMVVKATNDDGTVFDYEMIVNITDKDKDQAIKAIDASSYSFELTGDSCSSNGTNKWTISGVGDYKLKLTVKDKNGNESTKTIEFKVANKTEAKKNNDNVVGIVLIVISAVVLAGVILFFAFAGKKKSKKKLSK